MREPTGAAGVALYALSFALVVAAGAALFYGVLGSSRTLVWSSVTLSGLAVVAVAASLAANRR